ncbi:DUF1868 domain-containing protein [uncultured Roseobacter sp.]|uniref:DUF1868 domain-containing protein n=1 Tax=uncultured Roseobacter sp. TaxID=114847 RepID=UPI0026256135|nr:DUF1868 domain-containing protein [uncultured Roseobacter sp.]
MPLETDIATFAAGQNANPPARLGQRYSATAFLPEAGNTVVCHLDRTAPAHQAVLDARTRMQALPGAENFLYTPAESLHMTVFEGVIETRRTADAWPAGIDRDAPVTEVTEALMTRFEPFSPPLAFSVRVKDVVPTGLMLTGATAEDDRILQDWRDALTGPFGYRHKDHDAYRFHMTFAYPTGWIPDDLVPVWAQELNIILEDLSRAAPVIPLRAPAFCRFADMEEFEELRVLR